MVIETSLFKLQSRTGPVHGQNRVFPVYFSHTGKNLFSLQGSQVMKTGFSLLGKVHREIPVFITGMGLQCCILLDYVADGITRRILKNIDFENMTAFFLLRSKNFGIFRHENLISTNDNAVAFDPIKI